MLLPRRPHDLGRCDGVAQLLTEDIATFDDDAHDVDVRRQISSPGATCFDGGWQRRVVGRIEMTRDPRLHGRHGSAPGATRYVFGIDDGTDDDGTSTAAANHLIEEPMAEAAELDHVVARFRLEAAS